MEDGPPLRVGNGMLAKSGSWSTVLVPPAVKCPDVHA